MAEPQTFAWLQAHPEEWERRCREVAAIGSSAAEAAHGVEFLAEAIRLLTVAAIREPQRLRR